MELSISYWTNNVIKTLPHFSLICTKVDTYTKAKTKIKPSDIIISHFQIIDNVSFFLSFFLAHKELSSRISKAFNKQFFHMVFSSIFIIVLVLTRFLSSCCQENFLMHGPGKWLHEKIDNLSIICSS